MRAQVRTRFLAVVLGAAVMSAGMVGIADQAAGSTAGTTPPRPRAIVDRAVATHRAAVGGRAGTGSIALPAAEDIGLLYASGNRAGSGLVVGSDGNLRSSRNGPDVYVYSPTSNSLVASYAEGGSVSDLTGGPGGSVWFADSQIIPNKSRADVGQITTSGVTTLHPLPAADGPFVSGVAPDSSGNVWFITPAAAGGDGYVGYVAGNGAVTQFPLPAPYQPENIDRMLVAGADGNMWFIGDLGGVVEVGSVSPAGAISLHALADPAADGPVGITRGSDGAVWFRYTATIGQSTVPIVGSLSPSGVQHTYSLPADANPGGEIVEGADGNVYLAGAEAGTGRVQVTTISPSGQSRLVTGTDGLDANSMAAGPDGEIWLADAANFAELTTTRPYSTQLTLTADANPSYFGQAGNLVARLSPDQSGAPAPTGSVRFTTVIGGVDTVLGTASVVNGAADLPLASLPFQPDGAGNPDIPVFATYAGDADYGPQTSDRLVQAVDSSQTTLTLASSADPSVTGRDVHVTASLVGQAGGIPRDGCCTVSFSYDGTQQSVALTKGTATLDLPSLTAGSHTITASFAGSSAYGPSSASLTQAVNTDSCPCTVFPATATPAVADSGDGSGVEVGVKVRSATAGSITGVQFYKSAANTGTHTGSLWAADGTLLATGTFTGETAIGWQTLTFAHPVPIKANTVYVASYYAPSGHYAADGGYFAAAGAGAGPITEPADGAVGGDGVFSYGDAPSFPTSSYNATNYWVDVTFTDADVPAGAPTITATTPGADSTGVTTTTTVTATFSAPIDTGTLSFTLTDDTGAHIPGTVGYDGSTQTATFTPGTQLPTGSGFTASAQASDAWGQTMTTPFNWHFTTGATPAPYSCPCTLFAADAAPAVSDSGDTNSVELGVRFTPAVDGAVTGIRFYKGALNTGTHTGSLWAADGTLLASGTFTGETSTGWQTLVFATAVPITAGSTYVASYHAPAGNYSYTPAYFSYEHMQYPLTAPADASSQGNGTYAYGSTTVFPGNSIHATNYWIDVTFGTTPSS